MTRNSNYSKITNTHNTINNTTNKLLMQLSTQINHPLISLCTRPHIAPAVFYWLLNRHGNVL